ncbi:hypothetical protein [Streptomyces sp. NPDC005017]|uniref:hypothetical protein n=1 Tax=Streptomyces sp. NPDC005017 TaxID=3364706 RepID=UPI00368B68D1
MSDGIAWTGAHHHIPSSAVPGMLSGISLTLARGVETDEFLINLGADLDELAGHTPCRELRAPAGRPGRPSPHLNRAMS